MKKVLSLIICLVLACSFFLTAFATGTTADLNDVPAEITQDATATITVSVSESPSISSAIVQVTVGDGLELVSGEWKKDGIAKEFAVPNGYGVIAFSEEGVMDGTVFSFVVKGKTVSQTAQNINVDLTFKNGLSEVVGTASAGGSVKVVCASHTFGDYTNENETNHTRTCSVCGVVETNAHTWDEGTVTKTANCKETGVKSYTCTTTGCGATKTETIAETSEHEFGEWTQTKAPQCAEDGQESRICSICQKEETKDISATGHSFGEWTQIKAPDCETKGQETRTCATCSYEETRDIKATGHKFSNPVITKEPTCTKKGVETGKCTVCNKETTNKIDATGHKMGEYVVKTEATCTTEGVKEGICKTCGEKAEEKIPMAEHTYGEGVVTKEATATETGIMTKTCTACGEEVEEEIPVLDASNDVDTDTASKPAGSTSDKKVNNKSYEDNGNIKTIIIIVEIVVIVGGIAAFIIIKKRR